MNATEHAITAFASEIADDLGELRPDVPPGTPKYKVGDKLRWLDRQTGVEVLEFVGYDSRLGVKWYRCRYTDRHGEHRETIVEDALRRLPKPATGGPDNTIETAEMLAQSAKERRKKT